MGGRVNFVKSKTKICKLHGTSLQKRVAMHENLIFENDFFRLSTFIFDATLIAGRHPPATSSIGSRRTIQKSGNVLAGRYFGLEELKVLKRNYKVSFLKMTKNLDFENPPARVSETVFDTVRGVRGVQYVDRGYITKK